MKFASGGIEIILGKAKRALREFVMAEGNERWDNLGSYESPIDALAFHLKQLYERLLVIFEAAELNATRENLIARWKEFSAEKGGLRRVVRFNDFDHFNSPALEFIEYQVSALNMTINGELSTKDAWDLERLRAMLENTAGLVQKRNKKPASEIDVQNIMHDLSCAPRA